MRERGVDDLDVGRIEGKDVEGEELTAITVIFEADLSLLTVTVF